MARRLLFAEAMDARTLVLVWAEGDEVARSVRDLVHSKGFAAYLSTGIDEVRSLLNQRIVRPAALVYCSSGGIPKDLRAIQLIREADPAVRVVYVAAGCAEEEEAEVRRAGVHFFLLPDSLSGELPLVLAPLVRDDGSQAPIAAVAPSVSGETA